MALFLLQLTLILLLRAASILTSDANNSIHLNYPAIFNFGDSNSDTGELVAGLGLTLVPPHGKTYFGKPSGRFADGRLIVDFLVNASGHPFLNAHLESIGVPNFHTGCNFAAAGATIRPATANSICPFSFGVQVAQFLRFKARVLDLLSQEEKTSTEGYLPAKEYFHSGLYMFDIGQNDLAGSFYSKTYDQVVALIPTFLAQFKAGIKRLYDQGARNFWVHNTGPLGCLAQVIAKFGSDPSKLDKTGCVTTHNQAADIFNQQLRTLCDKIHGQYPDTNITYVDIHTIKSDLISNYTQYGFKQPIMACCGYGGPPLNYDSRVGCGRTVVINGTTMTATDCGDYSKYVNWDGIHYTEAANQHVASQILTGKYTHHQALITSHMHPSF